MQQGNYKHGPEVSIGNCGIFYIRFSSHMLHLNKSDVLKISQMESVHILAYIDLRNPYLGPNNVNNAAAALEKEYIL
jgi:hypothetical protein